MSHITTGETCVTSLEDARAAAEALGGTLMEGQATYTWYGEYLNDWNSSRAAVRRGDVRESDIGKCEHAIRVGAHTPGCYEVGLVRRTDGKGWDLHYDAFDGRIEHAFGKGLAKLKTEIGIRAIRRTYRGKRIQVTRENDRTRVRVMGA